MSFKQTSTYIFIERKSEVVVKVINSLLNIRGWSWISNWLWEQEDKPLEGILVHWVDCCKIYNAEEQKLRSESDRSETFSNGVNFLFGDFWLFHSHANFIACLFRLFKNNNQFICFQNICNLFMLSQSVKNLILNISQVLCSFCVILNDLVLLLLKFWHLELHKLVKHLLFKSWRSDSKVQQCDLHWCLRRIVRIWKSGRHKESEVIIVRNCLISNLDWPRASRSYLLLKKNRFKCRIKTLPTVFKQYPSSELNRKFNRSQKGRLRWLQTLQRICILRPKILDKLVRLCLRVNHQRPPSWFKDDDTIFNWEIIIWQPIHIPLSNSHIVSQDLSHGDSLSVVDAQLENSLSPDCLQLESVLCRESTWVGNHASCYQTVAYQKVLLLSQLLDCLGPSSFLSCKTWDHLLSSGQFLLTVFNLLVQVFLFLNHLCELVLEELDLIVDFFQNGSLFIQIFLDDVQLVAHFLGDGSLGVDDFEDIMVLDHGAYPHVDGEEIFGWFTDFFFIEDSVKRTGTFDDGVVLMLAVKAFKFIKETFWISKEFFLCNIKEVSLRIILKLLWISWLLWLPLLKHYSHHFKQLNHDL